MPFAPLEQVDLPDARRSSSANAQFVTSLGRCSHCNTVQGFGCRFKRCANCFGVKYCSKECQTRAWPDHKVICRVNTGLTDRVTLAVATRQLGFRSATAFLEALKEFVEMHEWALTELTKALIFQYGGVEHGIEWSQHPKKILYYAVYLREPVGLPEERQFSHLFGLGQHMFANVEDQIAAYPDFAQEWARLAPSRAFEDRRLSQADPQFAGSLPVMFTINGVPGGHGHLISFYPLYHSVFPSIAQSTLRPEDHERWFAYRKLLVEDAGRFCARSVNADFPLRIPDDPKCLVALPGRFVRSGGARIWRPLFKEWRDYRPGAHVGLDAAMQRLRMDPWEVMLVIAGS